MKNIILFSLLVNICGTSIFSQKCKPHISNTDKITEQTTDLWGGKLFSKSTLVNGKGYDIKFLTALDTDNDNKPYCVLDIVHKVHESRSDGFDISFEEGRKYIIKTKSSVLQIPVIKVFKNNNKFMSTYSVTNQLVSYMEKDVIQKLAQEDILRFRVITKNGIAVEGSVSKNVAKKLKSQFICFASTL